MEGLKILRTIALCGGAILLAIIALPLLLIVNCIGTFIDGIGTWHNEDEV